MPEIVHYVLRETREIEVSTAYGRIDALRTMECHYAGGPCEHNGGHQGSVVRRERIVGTTIERKK